MNKLQPVGAMLLGASLLPLYALASSHREAPEIAACPASMERIFTCSEATSPDAAIT